MGNLDGFNAMKIEPMKEYEPLPSGEYLAAIVKSEMKENKARTGKYLKLELQIVHGEYKNWKLFSILNLENPNAIAVKIAQSELSSICRAIGNTHPQDSSELHNIPMMVKVKRKKQKDSDDYVSSVTGYYHCDEYKA